MSTRWTTRAIALLRQELAPVQDHARELPWADKVPWEVHRRISTERRLWIRREKDQRIVRIDLHGLDADGARLACRLIRQALLTPDHPLRYVRVVVGRGKRSPGGKRVLAGIAAQVLAPEGPLARRSSTGQADNGFVDVWHRQRWPRVRSP